MGNTPSTSAARRRSSVREYHKAHAAHREHTGITTTQLKSTPVAAVATTNVSPDAVATTGAASAPPPPRSAAKPLTPSILTEDFIDGDYFSRGVDETATAIFDEEDDDGYAGIDEDLVDPGDGDDKRPVNVKYVDAQRNMVMGDQVYVVGSFDQWSKKVQLTPSFEPDGKLCFNTVLQLPLGVYRVRFFVNGESKHTGALPTATDKSGAIVNWFEVGVRDVNGRVEAGETENHNITQHMIRSSPSIVHDPLDAGSKYQSRSGTPLREAAYTQEIPEVFGAFLNASSDELLPMDEEFIHKHPIPELPVYLNNNYLNKHFNTHHTLNADTATLAKTNNTMHGLNSHIIPHVNLNHLLTSNIKNGVLGVASTTRYSGKFVTQIMYAPSEDGG